MVRKASASLLNAKTRMRSKGMQTDDYNEKRKLAKFTKDGQKVAFSRDLFADPDDYKRDWKFSLVYKRAM